MRWFASGCLLVVILGLVACRPGNATPTRSALQELQELAPEIAALPHSTAGLFLAVQEKYQEAIVEFDEAIRINPKGASVFRNRGIAYEALGEHQRALQDFDEAIRLDTKLALAFVGRGNAYAGLRQHERALQEYGQAISLDPTISTSYYGRAIVYARLGQDAKAQKDAAKAVELGLGSAAMEEALSEAKKGR